MKSSKIQHFSDITLQYIQKNESNSEASSINDQVNACIEKREKLEHLVGQDICPKLVSNIEQVILAFVKTRHQRYSGDLLFVCIMGEHIVKSLQADSQLRHVNYPKNDYEIGKYFLEICLW